jgi:hypothetical protein
MLPSYFPRSREDRVIRGQDSSSQTFVYTVVRRWRPGGTRPSKQAAKVVVLSAAEYAFARNQMPANISSEMPCARRESQASTLAPL